MPDIRIDQFSLWEDVSNRAVIVIEGIREEITLGYENREVVLFYLASDVSKKYVCEVADFLRRYIVHY